MSVYDNIYKPKFEKIEAGTKEDRLDDFLIMYELNRNETVASIYWGNLPERVYYDRPEMMLFYRSQFCLFEEEPGNRETLNMFPCAGTGDPLPNGFFSQYQIWSPTGQTWVRNFEDIEICENNPFKIPTDWFVYYFSEKMAEALHTVHINTILARGAALFQVKDEHEAAAVADFFQKCKDGQPISAIIKKDYNSDIKNLEVFKNTPGESLTHWEIFDKWNHLYRSTMGFNVTEYEKKERLNESETNANMDGIRHGFFSACWQSRLDFIRRANEHFGLDLYLIKNRQEAPDKVEEVLDEHISESKIMEEIYEEINEEKVEEVRKEEEVDETVRDKSGDDENSAEQ